MEHFVSFLSSTRVSLTTNAPVSTTKRFGVQLPPTTTKRNDGESVQVTNSLKVAFNDEFGQNINLVRSTIMMVKVIIGR